MNPLKLFGPTAAFSWLSDAWKSRKGINRFLDNIGSSVSSALGSVSSSAGDYLTSFLNQLTGAHLTGAQLEANELQMQNQEDIYQRQTAGMAAAGLNPALLYKGSESAPGVSSPSGSGSMSDLMAAVTLPLQLKMMRAQIKNVDADTQDKLESARGRGIENDFKPSLLDLNLRRGEIDIANVEAGIESTRASIEKMLSDIEVNRSQIDLNSAEIEEILTRASKEEVEAANEALRAAGIKADNALKAEQLVALRVQEALTIAQTALTDAQTFESSQRGGLVSLQAFEQQYNNLWLQKYGSKPSDNAASKLFNLIQVAATHQPDVKGFLRNVGLGRYADLKWIGF